MKVNNNELYNKTAVLLTRAQPFTLAHKELVKRMLANHSEVCIIIGSADKSRTKRNPFTATERLEIVYKGLRDLGTDNQRIKVFTLNDWESEDNTTTLFQWGSYLYYNIVSRVGNKDIALYYSDGVETLQKWFPPEIKEHITYVLNDRTLGKGTSATKVREEIIEDNRERVEETIASGCMEYYDLMRKILLEIEKGN